MKAMFTFAAAVIFAVSTIMLSPSPAAAQSVFESCGEDIASRCKAVTPGDGRVFACLYAHEDKISETCDEVIADVADLLDVFFEIIRYTNQECRADIERHCLDVEIGGGRIYSCLESHKSDLTSDCSAVIGEINMPDDG